MRKGITKLCVKCNFQIGTYGFKKHVSKCDGLGPQLKRPKKLRNCSQMRTEEVRIKRTNAIKRYYTEKRINDLEHWKQGLIEPTEWRARTLLIHELGAKCQKCSWAEINQLTNRVPIELEHTDGNYRNNKYYNLKLLCPNCHSLTPYYKALNARRGFGRPDSKVVSLWAKEKRIRVSSGKSY